MEKIIILILLLVMAMFAPLFFINDSKSVSQNNIICAKKTARYLYHPLEQLLIFKTTVDKENEGKIYTSGHTFFGLSYIKIQVYNSQSSIPLLPEYCDGSATVIHRFLSN